MRTAKLARRTILGIALLTISSGGAYAIAQNSRTAPPTSTDAPKLDRGTTVPSASVELTLNIPRVVREVPVKPGDMVKAGDLLLAQEDQDELVRLDILKHEAETNIPVDAAAAELEYKDVKLRRVEIMARDKVATQVEIDEATVEVKLARLQLEKAKFDKAKAQLEVKRQEELLKQMRILSPFDGIIEDTPILKGEVVDPQKPAIVMVRIDPLWVQVHLPSEKAIHLKPGQEMQVLYPGEENKPVVGRIIFLDPVVDATSNRRLVRLELPNPENRPAGLRIQVVLPREASAAAAR